MITGDWGAFAPEWSENKSSDCAGLRKPAAQEHPESPGYGDDDDGDGGNDGNDDDDDDAFYLSLS